MGEGVNGGDEEQDCGSGQAAEGKGMAMDGGHGAGWSRAGAEGRAGFGAARVAGPRCGGACTPSWSRCSAEGFSWLCGGFP